MISIRFITAAMMLWASSGISHAGPLKSENTYEIFRKDKKIGTHVHRFDKSGETFKVEAETHMSVKLLFVTAFSYDYLSEETWAGGKLRSVHTKTKNNGGTIITHAVSGANGYDVSRTRKKETTQSLIGGVVWPSNHWNPLALKQSVLFDTITAETFPVSVEKSAEPNLEGFEGTRYDVSGGYDYSTYYNAAGHWQGMTFERGGSFIEFRCVDCNNTIWPDDKPAQSIEVRP